MLENQNKAEFSAKRKETTKRKRVQNISSNSNVCKTYRVVLTEKRVSFWNLLFWPNRCFHFQFGLERSFWNLIKLMTNDPYPMGCCEKCRTIGELLFLLSKWDERAPLKNPLIFTAFRPPPFSFTIYWYWYFAKLIKNENNLRGRDLQKWNKEPMK